MINYVNSIWLILGNNIDNKNIKSLFASNLFYL